MTVVVFGGVVGGNGVAGVAAGDGEDSTGRLLLVLEVLEMLDVLGAVVVSVWGGGTTIVIP